MRYELFDFLSSSRKSFMNMCFLNRYLEVEQVLALMLEKVKMLKVGLILSAN